MATDTYISTSPLAVVMAKMDMPQTTEVAERIMRELGDELVIDANGVPAVSLATEARMIANRRAAVAKHVAQQGAWGHFRAHWLAARDQAGQQAFDAEMAKQQRLHPEHVPEGFISSNWLTRDPLVEAQMHAAAVDAKAEAMASFERNHPKRGFAHWLASPAGKAYR